MRSATRIPNQVSVIVSKICVRLCFSGNCLEGTLYCISWPPAAVNYFVCQMEWYWFYFPWKHPDWFSHAQVFCFFYIICTDRIQLGIHSCFFHCIKLKLDEIPLVFCALTQTYALSAPNHRCESLLSFMSSQIAKFFHVFLSDVSCRCTITQEFT